MIGGHLIVGYHGCDVTVRDGLVSGDLQPQESTNQYDWLGPGFYMFEGDEERARSFAHAAAAQPERRLTARPIATPAVVGCLFSVQNCLDMTTNAGRLEFEDAYLHLQAGFLLNDESPPINRKAGHHDAEILLRGLDRAVFSFLHRKNAKLGNVGFYQAVRGSFRQGVGDRPELRLPSRQPYTDSATRLQLHQRLVRATGRTYVECRRADRGQGTIRRTVRSHTQSSQPRIGSITKGTAMATKKPAVKMSTRKWAKGSPRRPTSVKPTMCAHFNSIKDELAYVYGSMTPEDDVRILYEAGILTPSGRLSSKFK